MSSLYFVRTLRQTLSRLRDASDADARRVARELVASLEQRLIGEDLAGSAVANDRVDTDESADMLPFEIGMSVVA